MIGATDLGKKRRQNQDSLYYDAPQGLGIVADGIGGRKGGEIASSMIVEGLKRAFLDSDQIRHEEINSFLLSTIDKLNRTIISKGREAGDVEGMGTTLNCLLFAGEKVHVAHVGDSRTYLFYKKHFWQLTIDHNIRNFIDRGWLPRNAVTPGVRDQALVRSIGLSENLEIDILDVDLKPQQIFLTCSDGLYSMVSDQRIAQIIYENINQLEKAAGLLIDEANRNGGKDNITVLLTQIRDE